MDNILAPGVKIELTEISENNDSRFNVYLSQIYDIEEEDKKLNIAMPIKEGKLIPLTIGKRFDCCFKTKNGLYQSVVSVLDRYKSNNLYVISVELKTPIKRLQRRQFFRYEITLEMRYAIIDEQAAEVIGALRTVPDDMFSGRLLLGNTLDISGGGVRFAGVKLEPNTKLYIEFDYGYSGFTKRFRAIANVLSSSLPPTNNKVYQNRINYEIVKTDDRENLIKFIFEEERRARRNERRV